MHPFSFQQALVFSLLAAGPLVAGFSAEAPSNDIEKRYVVSFHHVFHKGLLQFANPDPGLFGVKSFPNREIYPS